MALRLAVSISSWYSVHYAQFMVRSMTLSAARTTQCGMSGLINHELSSMWNKMEGAYLKALSWHPHGGTEETQENVHLDSPCTFWDSNPEPFEFTAKRSVTTWANILVTTSVITLWFYLSYCRNADSFKQKQTTFSHSLLINFVNSIKDIYLSLYSPLLDLGRFSVS
jgi:hypothetical protein